MKQQNKVLIMTISALLCAVGIIIPMFAPKLIIEPASFTLASHVPVFIAMFISPVVAISVAIITGFGFLFAGFPPVVVLRALTHVVFAGVGAYILKKNGKVLSSPKSSVPFSLFISALHAVSEVIVVTFFYWGNNMSEAYYKNGYFLTVVVLVGIGTLIHSMVDLSLAVVIWKAIQNVVTIPASVRISNKQ